MLPPLPFPLHHPRSHCPVVLIVVVPAVAVVVTIVAHAPVLFKSDVSFVEVDAGPCPLVPVCAQEKPAPPSPPYPKLSRRRIEMVHKKSPRLNNAFFLTMINIEFVGAGGFSCAHTGLKKMQKCVRPSTSSILGEGWGRRSSAVLLYVCRARTSAWPWSRSRSVPRQSLKPTETTSHEID